MPNRGRPSKPFHRSLPAEGARHAPRSTQKLQKRDIRVLIGTLGVDPEPDDLEEIGYRLNRLIEGLKQMEGLAGFKIEPWQAPDIFWRL